MVRSGKVGPESLDKGALPGTRGSRQSHAQGWLCARLNCGQDLWHQEGRRIAMLATEDVRQVQIMEAKDPNQ